MGLLRDSKSTIIDPSGRAVRAGDPEYHIKRLQDFSAGMGIDITSLKGDVTSKALTHYTDITNNHKNVYSNLQFKVHDEGLDTPQSVIEAADKTIKNIYGVARNSHITQPAWEELWHRSAYGVFANDSNSTGDGSTGDIYKRVVNHSPRHGFGSGITEFWDTENSEEIKNNPHLAGMETHLDSHQNFQSALKNTRYKFKVENMERSAPGRDVIDIVQQALRNPDEKTLQHILRTKPHLHSGQFVNVNYIDDAIQTETQHDVLDLGTGTWAKIEPDGYFPT
jgi:hypothetical protein